MSDLDKDIEEVKDLIEYSQNMINDMEYERPVEITISKEDIQSIENVLFKLEEWEKAHNLINESAVRIDNTPTTSTLEVDLNKLFTHIGFLDNATLVNIKLKNTTRYKVDLDTNKSELEKKDKMINVMADLMAHKIGTRTHICQHMTCDKKVAKECKSCVIEWAENEVK